MTLLEVMIALTVLLTAIMAVVQFVGVATKQRRASWQRQAAQLEVANQAERLALLDWDQTAPDTLTTWPPSEVLQAAIPDATCEIAVTEDRKPPVSRRILLRLGWKNAAGQSVDPVELSLWKFRPEAAP